MRSKVCVLGSGPEADRYLRLLEADGFQVTEGEAVPDGFDGIVVASGASGSIPWLPAEAVVLTGEEDDAETLRQVATRCAGTARLSHRLALVDGYAEPRHRTLVRDGETTTMTGHEAAVLAYLSAHRHRPVTREELLTEVWHYAPGVRSRAADSCVHRLRHKLEQFPKAPRHLTLIRGVGYQFVPLKPAPTDSALAGPEALRALGAVGTDHDLERLDARIGQDEHLRAALAEAIVDLGATACLELTAHDGGWSLLDGTEGARAWAAARHAQLDADAEGLEGLVLLAVMADAEGRVDGSWRSDRGGRRAPGGRRRTIARPIHRTYRCR